MNIGMNMGPRMELRPELRCEQRIALEQRLEARIEQQLRQSMRLDLYLEIEDLITGFMRYADEHKTWVDFDKMGFTFTYATLPYHVAKPIASVTGPGFAHCIYGNSLAIPRGSWVLFVVPDMIPAGLADFVALHEHGEELSAGNHYFASKLEFAAVAKQKKTQRYAAWIDEDYPQKFTDLTQEILFPIIPEDLIECLKERDRTYTDEMQIAEDLITECPLPTQIMRKVVKYGEITDHVCEKLRADAGSMQVTLMNSSYRSPDDIADYVDARLRKTLTSIPPEEARVVSRNDTTHALNFYGKLATEQSMAKTRRNLIVPGDFHEAHRIAQRGKRLVTVHYTTEDLARMRENPLP